MTTTIKAIETKEVQDIRVFNAIANTTMTTAKVSRTREETKTLKTATFQKLLEIVINESLLAEGTVRLNNIVEKYMSSRVVCKQDAILNKEFLEWIEATNNKQIKYKKIMKSGTFICSAQYDIELPSNEVNPLEMASVEEAHEIAYIYNKVRDYVLAENTTVNLTELYNSFNSFNHYNARSRFVAAMVEHIEADNSLQSMSIRKAGTMVCPADQEIDYEPSKREVEMSLEEKAALKNEVADCIISKLQDGQTLRLNDLYEECNNGIYTTESNFMIDMSKILAQREEVELCAIHKVGTLIALAGKLVTPERKVNPNAGTGRGRKAGSIKFATLAGVAGAKDIDYVGTPNNTINPMTNESWIQSKTMPKMFAHINDAIAIFRQPQDSLPAHYLVVTFDGTKYLFTPKAA